MEQLTLLLVLSPFILAIFVPILYKYIRSVHTGWFVFLLPLFLFVYFITYLPDVMNGNNSYYSVPWVPTLGMDFSVFIDGWGLLFALLITGIGFLVVLYSIYYLDKNQEKIHNFYVYLLMFMGAMLGVVLSDNILVLYVFWELTSLSSMLLISYWFKREASIKGAQKSTLITVFGGFTMLAGIALLYLMTGTLSIQEMIAGADGLTTETFFLPAMLLILVGALTKSAQFPFHIWLPDAMEAPTPVSAYLHSATMVKAGIYLIARFTPFFGGTAEWFWILASFGLFTLLYGSISAVRQKDLKSILAYSTISQLGMIVSLLGIGSAALYFDAPDELYTGAILAAVFHLINHATFKGGLFMAAGIVDHETGTRDIRKLGGLLTIMPATFTISAIGAASMAGLPPFNGFLSKEEFFMALTDAAQFEIFSMQSAGIFFPIIGWVASVFTFLYCCIFVFRTFGGKFIPENFKKEVHEAPIGMLISPIILVAIVVITGIFPNLLADTFIAPAMASILQGIPESHAAFDVNITHWHGFEIELFMTIGVFVLGGILYATMRRWQKLAIYNRERDIVNHVYDAGLNGLIRGSTGITNVQMTGRLRDYLAVTAIFLVLLTVYTMVKYNSFAINLEGMSDVELYEFIIIGMFIVSVIAIPFIQKRVASIVMLGFVGFYIAVLFVLFRAPDLAMTQLLVETVVVILFMLAFYHLPELRKEKSKPLFKWTNVIISVGVGVTVTLVALAANAYRQGHDLIPISQYHLENSADLAGGYNVVNVILVDYRGLDTVLELLVLGIAALAVYAVVKFRLKEGENEWQ
ncbi:Na+/H+ antiporter subunit A [Geomicrobium sp. JSM 1781026]|uniref:Na+/H+ antiporter subunit A n=1 Tax=Geomicrobium sp. JSM 1781026 TaxID=3344580 RepID=UPI0035C1062E